MSYLPVVTPKRLLRALRQVGFEILHQRGSHVVIKHVTDDRLTVVPYHARDLAKGTLKSILRDIGLDVDELKKLL